MLFLLAAQTEHDSAVSYTSDFIGLFHILVSRSTSVVCIYGCSSIKDFSKYP